MSTIAYCHRRQIAGLVSSPRRDVYRLRCSIKRRIRRAGLAVAWDATISELAWLLRQVRTPGAA
jgi:hypothetical protein